MNALKQSVLRSQLGKPLASETQSIAAGPGMAAIDARFSALDHKLDTLIHMLKGPDEDPGVPLYLLTSDIRRVVALYFNVTEQEMDRVGRGRKITRVRQIAYYLCRMHTTRSLPEIGRIFGERDHTTILHGVRKIDALRKTDAALEDDLSKIEARLVDLRTRRGAA